LAAVDTVISRTRTGAPRSVGAADGAPATKPTLVTTAYDRLRRDILRGVLRPGERLRLRVLADHYDCGMGALREALSRLIGDNMVAFEDRRGFSVPAITRKDLSDLLEMRLLLEEKALRESISRGGVDWEVAVMAAFHRLSRASEPRDADPRIVDEDWEHAHSEFHRALVSGYDLPLLQQFRTVVLAQSDRYRHIYLHYASKGRDHHAEHRQIMEAALRRDADQTVELMSRHLKRTVDLLLAAGFAQETNKPKRRAAAAVRKGR
jgi:DNA-binding GntR family transcriptional regulator